jgi:phage terminase large subunit-like protein
MLRGKSTRSFLESIASSVRTADSLEGRLYIADECGRYTDDVLGKMAIALAKPGTETRQLLMVTTPGQNRSNPYYRKRDTWEQELKAGALREEAVVLLYGIDEHDDPFDPSVWVKGNPMLAVGVMTEKAIQIVADDHRETLQGRSEFTREICCRYDDRDAAFVDLAFWDQCEATFDPLEVSVGRRVVAGADLSKSHDLTAVVFAVMDDDRNVYIWGHAWTCEMSSRVDNVRGTCPTASGPRRDISRSAQGKPSTSMTSSGISRSGRGSWTYGRSR